MRRRQARFANRTRATRPRPDCRRKLGLPWRNETGQPVVTGATFAIQISTGGNAAIKAADTNCKTDLGQPAPDAVSAPASSKSRGFHHPTPTDAQNRKGRFWADESDDAKKEATPVSACDRTALVDPADGAENHRRDRGRRHSNGQSGANGSTTEGPDAGNSAAAAAIIGAATEIRTPRLRSRSTRPPTPPSRSRSEIAKKPRAKWLCLRLARKPKSKQARLRSPSLPEKVKPRISPPQHPRRPPRLLLKRGAITVIRCRRTRQAHLRSNRPIATGTAP